MIDLHVHVALHFCFCHLRCSKKCIFLFLLFYTFLGFLLELQKDGCKMADSATLLSLSDSIHLVLIKTDPSGDTTLIGSHFLTWRDILSIANGRMMCPVEINGVGTEAKVPMGILEIKFEMIPRLSQVSVHSSCSYDGDDNKDDIDKLFKPTCM